MVNYYYFNYFFKINSATKNESEDSVKTEINKRVKKKSMSTNQKEC